MVPSGSRDSDAHVSLVQDPPDPQLMRLDNMLVAEGVVGVGEQARPTGDSTTITHPDYKNKLSQIRTIYSEEMEKYQQGCEVGSGLTLELLLWKNFIFFYWWNHSVARHRHSSRDETPHISCLLL